MNLDPSCTAPRHSDTMCPSCAGVQSLPIVSREVCLSDNESAMSVHTVFPVDAPTLPAVIVFMDAPGIRPELLQMTERLASQGFYCVVPDLYHRLGRIRLDLERRSEAHALVYRTLASTLLSDQVLEDTERVTRFLHQRPEAGSGPIGCLGFSIGGRFAMAAAAALGPAVAAAAGVCATGLVTDQRDSPHRVLPNARAALLLDFAERDPAISATVISTLEAVLRGAGARFEINVESGTEHGYTFPSRPMFHKAAAERTWQRISALFQRSLVPGASTMASEQ
jgi:carboxymethylenebutenolidase